MISFPATRGCTPGVNAAVASDGVKELDTVGRTGSRARAARRSHQDGWMRLRIADVMIESTSRPGRPGRLFASPADRRRSLSADDDPSFISSWRAFLVLPAVKLWGNCFSVACGVTVWGKSDTQRRYCHDSRRCAVVIVQQHNSESPIYP